MILTRERETGVWRLVATEGESLLEVDGGSTAGRLQQDGGVCDSRNS